MTQGFRGGLLAALLFAVGCGGTGTVSGVVRYKGKPVVVGRVTAVGKEGGPRIGVIQPDGSYEIQKLPVGPVRFAVESPNPGAAPDVPAGEGVEKKPTPSGWQPLPPKFANVNTSELTLDVKAGSNTKDLLLD